MNAPQIDLGRAIRKDRRPRSAAVKVPGYVRAESSGGTWISRSELPDDIADERGFSVFRSGDSARRIFPWSFDPSWQNRGSRTYRPGPEELKRPAVDNNLVGCRRIDGRANGEEFSVRSLRRHLALRPCVPCASGAPAGLDVDRLPGHDVKPGRVREQQVLPVVLVMMAMAPGPCPGRTAGDDALAGQGARGRGRLTLNPDKWTGWPDPTPDGPACAGFRS